MQWIKPGKITKLFERALNYVDPRLVNHGKRVAYLVAKMLEAQNKYDQKIRQSAYFLALVHDIGAYRTEEIDQLVRFETEKDYQHSVYGYLFVRELSPLKELSKIILYHHTRHDRFPDEPSHIRELSQMICLADRIDIFRDNFGTSPEKLLKMLNAESGKRFDPYVIEQFLRAEKQFGLLSRADSAPERCGFMDKVAVTEQEVEAYLHMLVSSIDFRSRYTVTHTVNTIFFSKLIAKKLGVGEKELSQIAFGALLHDIGKIGTPVEILENPAKLTPEEMAVMRRHVEITHEIIRDIIEPDVVRIATRHHEKLDGSGYPAGLKDRELTLAERIVAVADIASALRGTRSYKEAFSQEKIHAILGEMNSKGLLDSKAVAVVQDNLDRMVAEVDERSMPVIQVYDRIQAEYAVIMRNAHKG